MEFLNNRYMLDAQLGKGSLGVVYRAYDALTGNFVALKRIQVDPATAEINPAAASPRYQHTHLVHEFRTLAALGHPNIVRVFDYGFTAGRKPFFVMELLENAETIREACGKQNTHGKIDLIMQVLQAIAYLHRHGILHRDLKPNNVFVTQDGQVKILDFGIAAKREKAEGVAGTIHYMAPETIRGEGAQVESDLFSIGVIAYELLTGARPFPGETVKEVALRTLNTAPNRDLYDRIATLDPLMEQVGGVIFRLLEKEPKDRYRSAIEVIVALYGAMGEPLPPDENAIRESFIQSARFVGRERELDKLTSALIKAKIGTGSGWLVGGESGIGKSRLLDELKIHALAEGMLILCGQFVENEPFPSLCWRYLLPPLALCSPMSDEEAKILKNVIPDIDRLLNREIEISSNTSWADFCLTVIQTLSRMSLPAVILIEDLQWSGKNLEVLEMLVPLLQGLPLMLVGSYRSDEMPDLPEQLAGVSVMQLERLTLDNIAELSESMLGEAGCDPKILDLLQKETEGNAFFMVEVVRALAEEAGQLSAVGQVSLPDHVLTGGIHQLMDRRLNRVPDWARSGLELAAMMGRKLDLPVLDRILSPIFKMLNRKDLSLTISTALTRSSGITLNDWLLTCADAGILEVYEGDWRFTHDKLREHLLADFDEKQAAQLRRLIAKITRIVYPDRVATFE